MVRQRNIFAPFLVIITTFSRNRTATQTIQDISFRFIAESAKRTRTKNTCRVTYIGIDPTAIPYQAMSFKRSLLKTYRAVPSFYISVKG